MENVKEKKPFYKKWWFIVLVGLTVLIFLSSVVSNIKNRVKWEDLILGEYIPKINEKKIRVSYNSNTSLAIDVNKSSVNEFNNYKQECINMGYNLDVDEYGNSYEAFNKDGYKININFFEYDKEYRVRIEKPDVMNEIKWPTGLGKLVPQPESNIGIIYTDNSKSLRLKIGNMSFLEYQDYVLKCEEAGFDVDYDKDNKRYKAKNLDGYELIVSYLGGNVIEIYLKATVEEEKEQVEEPKEETNNNKVEESVEEPEKEEVQPEKEETSNSVSYSTNDSNSVKNGNTGVYAYQSRTGNYDNYYIIDLDNKYVYFFSDGNGDMICTRAKISSGDLNSVVVVTYNDGNTSWQEGLHFKYKRQPDHLIMEDSDHYEFDFYSTNLNAALKIRDTKTISDY